MIQRETKHRAARGWTEEFYRPKIHFQVEMRREPRCNTLQSVYRPLTLVRDIAKVTCQRCLKLLEQE